MSKISKRQKNDVAYILKMLQSEKRYLDKIYDLQIKGQEQVAQIKAVLNLLTDRSIESEFDQRYGEAFFLLRDKVTEIGKMLESSEILACKAMRKVV